MIDLAEKYKLPVDIVKFVENGFIEMASDDEARRTVRFDIPSLGIVTDSDEFTFYTLIWIHPDYNAEFCDYYIEKPGDLPNFYVEIHSPNAANRQVEDLNEVDDLVDWLEEAHEAKRRSSLSA